MKKIRGHMFAVLTALVFVLAALPTAAQHVDITLPTTFINVDEFLEFRNVTATTPEGGAAVFVLAMLLYEIDEEVAHDAMVIALDAGELKNDQNGYRGFTYGYRAKEFITRYLKPKPYLARSYVLGTTPDGQYQPPEELVVRLTRNRYSIVAEDRVKVFVACSGADSPRPMTLKMNNRGIWKAYEYSSLFVGIRPPVEIVDDPL